MNSGTLAILAIISLTSYIIIWEYKYLNAAYKCIYSLLKIISLSKFPFLLIMLPFSQVTWSQNPAVTLNITIWFYYFSCLVHPSSFLRPAQLPLKRCLSIHPSICPDKIATEAEQQENSAKLWCKSALNWTNLWNYTRPKETQPVSEWAPPIPEEDGEIWTCANGLSQMFTSYLTKAPTSEFVLFISGIHWS